MTWREAQARLGIAAQRPAETVDGAFAFQSNGVLCTVSLWGEEWWLHAGLRGISPVGYVVASRAPAGLAIRLTAVPWDDY